MTDIHPASLAIIPNSNLIAITTSTSRSDFPSKLLIYSIETGERVACVDRRCRCVICSPDGKYLATLGYTTRSGDSIHIWHTSGILYGTNDAALVKTLTQERRFIRQNPINVISFTPDSQYIVSGDARNQTAEQTTLPHDPYAVRLWSVESGECIAKMEVHQKYITSLSLSENFIFSSSHDKNVAVCHIEDFMKPLGERNVMGSKRQYPVECISMSPDNNYGAFLYSLTPDNYPTEYKFEIINFKTGATLIEDRPGSGSSKDLMAFSTDGKYFALGDYETVKLWNVKTRKCIWQTRRKEKYTEFMALNFSPDGQHLVFACIGSIEVWTSPRKNEEDERERYVELRKGLPRGVVGKIFDYGDKIKLINTIKIQQEEIQNEQQRSAGSSEKSTIQLRF